jgi:hypothetical protein
MNWLDMTDTILEWGSEEFSIPYKSPVDNRVHRYFPDFYVKVKQKDDTIRVMIIEVKPAKQTRPPEKKKKVTKQYIQVSMNQNGNPQPSFVSTVDGPLKY